MTEPQEGRLQCSPCKMNNQRPAVKTWTSAELLGGAHEARIQHGAEVYRLLLTRNGKLILVK